MICQNKFLKIKLHFACLYGVSVAYAYDNEQTMGENNIKENRINQSTWMPNSLEVRQDTSKKGM